MHLCIKMLIIIIINNLVGKNVLANAEKRPNIIIIMADDLGFDDVSFRGGKEWITPNIDSLAYHGKILNRLYTPPTGTASRAAFLTGMWPIHTGTQHYMLFNEDPWGVVEDFTTMAEVFQDEGYSTHLVGKWHLGMGRKKFTPTYNGFDSHFGFWGAYIDYFTMTAKMPTNYSMGYDFRRNMNMVCNRDDSYVTDLITFEAETIIMKHQKSAKPLFLMVSHLATHAANEENPLQAPQAELNKFKYIYDRRRKAYAAMVSKLDQSVGRIVRALSNYEQLENSIVLFYSDNGGASAGMLSNSGSNWPLRGQKYTPWEGGVRVVGAIWSPLLKNKGSIYQIPMHVVDWLPTLTSAANISLDTWDLSLDGVDHWPDLVRSTSNLLTSNNSVREILHMLDDRSGVESIMSDRFKYIKGTTLQGRFTFDDVILTRSHGESDPRENNYIDVIKDSIVSDAVRDFDEKPLDLKKIKRLRRKAEVKCGQVGETCNPLEEECLFNIWYDPCEQNNLAKDPTLAQILNYMRNRLDDFRITAIPPLVGGSSINNDPSRHDCVWTNYLDEPIKDFVMTCDKDTPTCD